MQEDLELSVGIGGEKAFIASLKSMDAAVDRLTLSVDKLDKESANAGSGMQKMGGSASSLGTIVGGIGLANMANQAAQAIIGLGKASLNTAIEYESLSISLGVLLGDASKVPSVLAEWKKFSDVTPFEPDQVNRAGKALLAFGFQTEELIPLMTKIGDVSAGTGKDFNELISIYGKARTSGKIMGDDLRQLGESGINILPEIAKQLGITVEEVAKAGSESKISFEVFQKAFAGLAAEGGKFGGMMDKLSQSTEGILSTLRGEFDGLLREVGTAFLPIIKELAMAAIPMLQSALKAMQPYLAQIPVIFERVKAFAKPMLEPLQRIWDAFMRISDAIKPITDILFPSLGGQFESVEKKGGLITKVLEAIAWVLEGVASAVEWVNEKWAAFVESSPIIAKAVQYLVAPFTMVNEALFYMGDLLTGILGSGSESVGGLADASKKKLGDFSKYLQSSFGATSQQVVGFAKSFDMARIAGMSEADAMYEVKKAFGIYIATCDEATTSTDALGGALTDASKKAVPAAGSIDALNERLKVLKDQYNATASASERLRLGGLIQDAEIQVELMNAQGEAMGNVAMKTKAVNDEFTKLQATTGNMMRSTDGMGSMHEMLMQIPLDLETTTTAWERFQAKIGEGASGQLKQGIDNIKNAFRDFGAQAAESIGYAIGSAGSAAQAFKAAVSQMLVQIPKLAGMALLNAAAFPANAAISLPLAAAGLALLGLSGIIGGVQAKNAREQEALADSMSDLPTSATGAAGAASLGGLGGYTGASQQQAPVMVNVNAEMDGVQLGGLIKRVTTNYNKTTIKQR